MERVMTTLTVSLSNQTQSLCVDHRLSVHDRRTASARACVCVGSGAEKTYRRTRLQQTR